MLTVTLENLRDVVILRCAGKIVWGQETVLLCVAIRQHRRNIILDLSRVDAIDAAGIGVLVSLQAAGVYLKLMNPTRHVREILSLAKLDSIFEICESESSDEVGHVSSRENLAGDNLRVGVVAIQD